MYLCLLYVLLHASRVRLSSVAVNEEPGILEEYPLDPNLVPIEMEENMYKCEVTRGYHPLVSVQVGNDDDAENNLGQEQRVPDELFTIILENMSLYDKYWLYRRLNRRYSQVLAPVLLKTILSEQREEGNLNNRFWIRTLLSEAVLHDNEFSNRIIDKFAKHPDTLSLVCDPRTLFMLILKRPRHFKAPAAWFTLSLVLVVVSTILQFKIPGFLPGLLAMYGFALFLVAHNIITMCRTRRLFERD